MNASPLLEAARAAFDALPLYRRLWGRRPTCEADIPFIGAADLCWVEGPDDFFVGGAVPIGIVPPFQRGWSPLPATRIEAEGDWLLRQSRLISGLSHVLAGKLPRRTALVTDDAHGPFAADLVELLAWSRIEASLVYVGAEADWVATALGALAPDLVLVMDSVAGSALPFPQVAVLDAAAIPAAVVPGATLLACDALQIVAAARAGEAGITAVDDSVRLEIDPTTTALAVTSLRFAAAPVIRWRVGPGRVLA